MRHPSKSKATWGISFDDGPSDPLVARGPDLTLRSRCSQRAGRPPCSGISHNRRRKHTMSRAWCLTPSMFTRGHIGSPIAFPPILASLPRPLPSTERSLHKTWKKVTANHGAGGRHISQSSLNIPMRPKRSYTSLAPGVNEHVRGVDTKRQTLRTWISSHLSAMLA